MTALSLSEAAAATGLNKTTVLRSIKSGKISGTRDPLGGADGKSIAAELHRVRRMASETARNSRAQPRR